MVVLVSNPRVKFNYEILETLEAGIELKGYEVKALRSKKGSLTDSRIIFKKTGAYVLGMNIPPYQKNNVPAGYDSEQERRILLKKTEIGYLASQAKMLTIIPLRVYTKNKYIKIEIALAKIRKKIDKRELIREREEKQKMERFLKNQYF